MRLISLLAWYDESERQLATHVLSLAKAGVSHLVAVDGAYALFPDGMRHSDGKQHLAIQYTAAEAGMGLTIHAPQEVWTGNETEKRTALFDLGLTVAKEGDWFLVLDADETITKAPDDLFDRLEHTDCEVGRVTMRDLQAEFDQTLNRPTHVDRIRLFRAQQITVERKHYTYHRADGKVVHGDEHDIQVGIEDVLDLEFEHRRGFRDPDRQYRQGEYYDAVVKTASEHGNCKCGQPAKRTTPVGWRMTEHGPAAKFGEFCDRCAKRVERKERARLKRMGIDPDSIKVGFRYGKLPPARAAVERRG